MKWPDTLPKVSIQHMREPLRLVVKDIATKTGLTLETEAALRESKALIVIENRPASEVLEVLARVFGGEWINPDNNKRDIYRLIQKPEVRSWANFYKRQMQEAEQFAREKQAEKVRDYFEAQRRIADSASTNGATPSQKAGEEVSIARFLASLSPTQINQLAAFYGQQFNIAPTLRPFAYRVTFAQPPIVLPFGALPEDSQEQMKIIRRKRTSGTLGETDYSRLSVAVTSQSPPKLDVFLVVPIPREIPSNIPGCAGYSVVGGFNVESIPLYDEYELKKIQKERLHQNLIRRPIPSVALLGSNWTQKGDLSPLLTLKKEDSLTAISDFSRSRWRVLAEFAKQQHLNLVADYHTETDDSPLTMEIKENPTNISVKAQLQRFVERKGCVVRFDSEYILSRKIDWVERDLREIPWPLVEKWSEEKRKYSRLYLDSLSEMCQLPIAKMDGLVCYRDDFGIELLPELRSVRGNAPAQGNLLYSYVNQLSAETKNAARKKDGVPLTELPPAIY